MPDSLRSDYHEGEYELIASPPVQDRIGLGRWLLRSGLSGFFTIDNDAHLRFWLDDGDGVLESDNDVLLIEKPYKRSEALFHYLQKRDGHGSFSLSIQLGDSGSSSAGFTPHGSDRMAYLFRLRSNLDAWELKEWTASYSHDPHAPSALIFQQHGTSFNVGENGFSSSNNLPALRIRGTVGGGEPTRADYVSFRVPAGHELSGFFLNTYESDDQEAFIGLQRGRISTASAAQPDALLAWTHFGPGAEEAQPGTDLIKTLGGPLGPGRYTAWIQQLGSETRYEFGLQASLLSGESANGNAAQREATAKRDLLTGHTAQSDVFRLPALTDSLLRDYDTITDYETAIDKIEVSGRSYRTMIHQSLIQVSMQRPLGALNSLKPGQVRRYLNADVFEENAAVSVRVDGFPGVFLALNDETPGFQANADAIVHIDNHLPLQALPITVF